MKTMIPTALLLFLIGIWELTSRLMDKAYILPSPAQIVMRTWELKEVLFLKHLPPTLLTMMMGLGISIVLGTSLAVWMYVNETVRKALYPLLIASQMIPVIALAPIFVLWFGYTIWSKVAVATIITFFPITVNAFDGLASGDKATKELFQTMGASKKDIFLKYSVPLALPHFFSGLKVAVTLSVIGAAIGEWLGAQAGLGYFSRRMMTQFDGPAVFAPIFVLSILGILLFLFISSIEKRCLHWRTQK